MVSDFQTSMAEIRKSNLVFIELLKELKNFVSRRGTVTITVGGVEKTFPTIPELVVAYRGGDFSEIVLKSSDSEIHIKNDNGTLKVTDASGALVPLTVSQLKFSNITSCNFESIHTSECTIDKLSVQGSVEAASANFQSLEVVDFEAGFASVQNLSAGTVSAGSALIPELGVQRLVYMPRETKDIFAGSSPYNYSDSNAVFLPYPEGDCYKYVCRDLTSEERSEYPLRKDPSTMGFVDIGGISGSARLLRAPDMMTFQGTTECSDYEDGDAGHVGNCFVMGTGANGNTLAVTASRPLQTQLGDDDGVPFARILGWPITSYIAATSIDRDLSQIVKLLSTGSGAIFLHEFSSADIGRIIFIRTLGNPWTICRRLIAVYKDGVHTNDALDLEYEIPPYTCLRLRMVRAKHVIDTSVVQYHNILEIA